MVKGGVLEVSGVLREVNLLAHDDIRLAAGERERLRPKMPNGYKQGVRRWWVWD